MEKDIIGRKDKILGLIVENYIETASPISSRSISRRLRHGLSSATIRNIMADLEETGLITHPHTSAGRVPTDKGYRYYVNKLMQVKLLTEEEKKKAYKAFKQKTDELDDVLTNASRILSAIAEEAGFVTFPMLDKSIFQHIEILEISANEVLIVLITKYGITKNILLKLENTLKKGDLVKISSFLNSRLNGTSLSEIKKSIAKQLLVEKDSFFYILDETKNIIDSLLGRICNEKIFLDGASRMAVQPEFKDLNKMETLFKLFENPGILSETAKKISEVDGINIYIGEEIEIKDLCDCSFVACNYKIKDNNSGVLGIIGPKRMHYSKMVSIVDYISNMLSEVLQ